MNLISRIRLGGILTPIFGLFVTGVFPAPLPAQFTLQKLENPDVGTQTSSFGRQFAMDGDTLVASSNLSGNEFGIANVYRRQVDGTWEWEASLGPGVDNDGFGDSLAISGDTIAVGVPRDDEAADNSGAVMIYTRSSGIWSFQGKILGRTSLGEIHFGRSVALSGETMVVGSPNYAPSGFPRNYGAGYVYVRSGTTWSLQQRVTALDAEDDDFLGTAVDIEGDTIAVGAPSANRGLGGTGVAYVFRRSGTTWTQQQRISSPNGAGNERFGASLKIEGDTLLVSAPDRNTSPTVTSTGTAHVFTFAGTWTHQQELLPSTVFKNAKFGVSLDLLGDSILIGSLRNATSDTSSGAVYLFQRSAGVWTETAKIVSPAPSLSDGWGGDVAFTANSAVVSASGDDYFGENAGAVHTYSRSGATLTPTEVLRTGDAASEDSFGTAVAMAGGRLFLGANRDARPHDSGSVRVYSRSGLAWVETQLLKATDAEVGDEFGGALAADGETLVVGADRSDDGGEWSGSAYVFVNNGGAMVFQRKLIASDDATGDFFGEAVAVSGDTALIGASSAGTEDYGAAYVFKRSGTIWTQQQKLRATDRQFADALGYAVALSGDVAVLGTPGDDDGGTSAGAAYVFTRSGSTWTQRQKLVPLDPVPNAGFGLSVAVEGTTVIVGAPRNSGNGSNSGAVYVFREVGGVWIQQQKLAAQSPAANDHFGGSLALSGDKLLVGATGRAAGRGAAHLFLRDGGTWSESAELTPSGAPPAAEDAGNAVAISGNDFVVCASNDDDPERDAGAAYVFTYHTSDANEAWMLME